jgi:large subunit ribosomal protein L18
MAITKRDSRLRIKRRVRGKISGNTERPRLSVYRSNKQIYAQVIDDTTGRTLASASSVKLDGALPKIDQAAAVGKAIAEAAKAAGIETVVFDRNGYLYHGRVKQLAEAAREGGLKF